MLANGVIIEIDFFEVFQGGQFGETLNGGEFVIDCDDGGQGGEVEEVWD